MPRFTFTRKIVALGADYDVTREDGTLAYRIDGKLRFAFRILIRDAYGADLLSVHEKLFALDRDVLIRRGDETIATMTRVFTKLGISEEEHKYVVEHTDGSSLEARGAFYQDDWSLVRGEHRVARIRERKGTIAREIYDVEITDGEDEPLPIAVIAAIIKLEPNRGSDSP